MEAVVTHFQTHATYYIGGAIVLLPVLIYFRKWTFPALFFTVETLLYLAIMHLVLAGIVRAGAWFKGETAMEVVGEAAPPPNWTTPLYEFWRVELYEPRTVAYVELALAAAVVLAVIRFRPLRFKRRRKRKSEQVDPEKAAAIRKAREAAGRVGYGPDK